MTKNEEAEARAALLQRWIDDLERGYASHRDTIDAMLEASAGEPVTVPNLEIRPVSRDMMEILLGGLRRALDGEQDPFRINQPRGKKPLLSGSEKLNLAMCVILKKEAGIHEEEAIEIVAEEFGISPSSAKEFFYSKKKWAQIQINTRRQYKRDFQN